MSTRRHASDEDWGFESVEPIAQDQELRAGEEADDPGREGDEPRQWDADD